MRDLPASIDATLSLLQDGNYVCRPGARDDAVSEPKAGPAVVP